MFAVGDRKQSIYSFQGADPTEFDRWRDLLAQRVRGGRRDWRDVGLDVSFRSTAPVLALVDAVFADPLAAAGRGGAGRDAAPLSPTAPGMPGSVELWPLAPPPEAAPPEPWTVPEQNLGADLSAPQRLAEALADWIAAQTGGAVMLESRAGRCGPATCWCWCAGATISPARWCGR